MPLRFVVDIETTSACDLPACGARVYAEDPSTRILCIAWTDADTDGEPWLWRCDSNEPLEDALARILRADLLIAHNAGFERANLRRYDPRFATAARWADSAMLSGAAGRPHSLRDACRSLRLPAELEKDARGKRLLNMFSVQSSKLYVGGPEKAPQAFNELCEYCRQDVRAERAVWRTLADYYTPLLQRQWAMDCAVDDAGIPIDRAEIDGAARLYSYLQEDAEARAYELTGGVPMRSTVGLREWTASKGWPLDSFAREAVADALADQMMCDAHPEVARFLRLRSAAAGTAGKKFAAFQNTTCADGRIRGTLQARVAHTGRYAGRGIQPQNLPRGYADPALLPIIRGAAIMASKDLWPGCDWKQALEILRFACDGQECDALAGLCRDAIRAPEGRAFVVADYSAVEARVLAWLAREKPVEAVFAGDGKIYERTAADIYHKSPDGIDKHERMAGKIATLALGYGGGVSALQRFAKAYGVTWNDDEALEIVRGWRASRPQTVKLWKAVELAFARAGLQKEKCAVPVGHGVQAMYSPGAVSGIPVVECVLPSGRKIVYWDPRYDRDADELSIDAVDGRNHVYGGLLVENLTQAVAFDLLLGSLLELYEMHAKELRVVMHIHDEIVSECAATDADAVAQTVRAVMERVPKWGRGLVLKAEPEIMQRYKK